MSVRQATRFVNLSGLSQTDMFGILSQLDGHLPAFSGYRALNNDSLTLHFDDAETAQYYAATLSLIMLQYAVPLCIEQIHVTIRSHFLAKSPEVDELADLMDKHTIRPLIWRIPARGDPRRSPSI